MSAIVHVGNVLDILPTLEAGSVNCVVCSPPYWGLRDYGTATWEGGDAACDHKPDRSGGIASSTLGGGKKTTNHQQEGYARECPCGARRIDSQLGLESTPEEYVANMVAVFREVRRILRDDGTLWLNLGDSYAGSWGNQGRKLERGTQRPINSEMLTPVLDGRYPAKESNTGVCPPGLKPKDLCMIPARVALALQADGWYLRSDIIWAKPNPMPSSARDRCTVSHEYLFLLTKSARYWYDADAIAENTLTGFTRDRVRPNGLGTDEEKAGSYGFSSCGIGSTRNRRTVWTIATQPYPEAHFATYPEKLVEPCVLAGCPAQVCSECGAPWAHVVDVDSHPNYTADGQKHDGTYYRPNPGGGVSNDSRTKTDRGWQPTCTHDAGTTPGTVLDPFTGSGTTGAVACRLGRNFIGIELSPEYAEMAERRIAPHRDQMQLEVLT